MAAFDAIQESDWESDDDHDDRHIEDVSIAEEIPSQPNDHDSLDDYFARLNIRLDSI